MHRRSQAQSIVHNPDAHSREERTDAAVEILSRLDSTGDDLVAAAAALQENRASTVQDQVRLLELAKDSLNVSDRSFAESLCNAFNRGRTLSTKQIYWVGKLLQRASRPAPVAATQVNVTRIIELFERARLHLKFPAIVLSVQQGQRIELFRFSLAGERARFPGSINITSYEKNPATGQRNFFGRVHRDGHLESHENADAQILSLVIQAVKKFAADPVGVAAAHGRLTGHCCFCHKRLTDERSTAVGYGKICASHFGLSWGSTEGHAFNCDSGE